MISVSQPCYTWTESTMGNVDNTSLAGREDVMKNQLHSKNVCVFRGAFVSVMSARVRPTAGSQGPPARRTGEPTRPWRYVTPTTLWQRYDNAMTTLWQQHLLHSQLLQTAVKRTRTYFLLRVLCCVHVMWEFTFTNNYDFVQNTPHQPMSAEIDRVFPFATVRPKWREYSISHRNVTKASWEILSFNANKMIFFYLYKWAVFTVQFSIRLVCLRIWTENSCLLTC